MDIGNKLLKFATETSRLFDQSIEAFKTLDDRVTALENKTTQKFDRNEMIGPCLVKDPVEPKEQEKKRPSLYDNAVRRNNASRDELIERITDKAIACQGQPDSGFDVVKFKQFLKSKLE